MCSRTLACARDYGPKGREGKRGVESQKERARSREEREEERKDERVKQW